MRIETEPGSVFQQPAGAGVLMTRFKESSTPRRPPLARRIQEIRQRDRSGITGLADSNANPVIGLRPHPLTEADMTDSHAPERRVNRAWPVKMRLPGP
jgi:hypothetical protein